MVLAQFGMNQVVQLVERRANTEPRAVATGFKFG